jgi:drug/metabolite transporter (DMT)-like permease
MSWQTLIIIHNVLSAVFVIAQRKLAVDAQGKYNIQIVLFMHSFIALIGVGWAIAAREEINVSAAFDHSPLFVAASGLFFISSLALFKMFRYLDAAIGTIVNLLSSFMIVLFSGLFLGSTLQGYDVVGALLLAVAVWILFSSRKNKKLRHTNWSKGLTLAAIGAVSLGGAITIEKYLVDRIGAVSYVPFGFTFQWATLFLFSIRGMKPFIGSIRAVQVKGILFAGVVRGFAGLTFLLSLSRAQSSAVIGTLTALKVVIVSVLSVLVLRETELLKRKALASLIAFGGVLLLFL